MNITNLFNNDSPLSYNTNPFAGPSAGNEFLAFPAPKGAVANFATALTGYDPIAAANLQGLTYNNRYGLPFLFQNRRTMRLTVSFTF